MLLAVGLAGGAAAVAVATVPDSSGVVHACYSVDGSGNPVTTGANLTVIDPSAGQTCSSPAGAAANRRALDWNVTGPAGQPGSPGQQGPQGPPGNTATITKGGTLTLSGGQVLQVESAGGGVTLPTPSRHLPGGSNMAIGSGASALSFPILSVSLLGSGAGGGGSARTSVHDISITKTVDKSSPKLFQACANGKHFPKVAITLRKAGGKTYLRYDLKQVFVTSIQSAGAPNDTRPTEQVTLTYASVQIHYLPQ